MSTYQGPMIVARGLYLGPDRERGKALWLATPREQLEFPVEMAPYLKFACGVLRRDESEALLATLEHGHEAIGALVEAGVILELPADVGGALKSLAGKQVYPLGLPVTTEDSEPGADRVIHDVTVRRPNTDETVIIRHPLSTIMEDLEHDLAGAIEAVAESTGREVGDILGSTLAQLGHAIVERVGYLSDSGYDNG